QATRQCLRGLSLHQEPFLSMSPRSQPQESANVRLLERTRPSFVSPSEVLIELSLKNPQDLEKHISTRVPPVANIVGPLRMKRQTLDAPIHASIQTAGPKPR